MRRIIDKIRRRREERRRNRERARRDVYHVEELATEDVQHDDEARLDDDKPTVRWIGAEEGDEGYRFYEWLGDRAEPLGRHHVLLARLQQELAEALGRLAKAESKAKNLRDNLNEPRLRWFLNGLTRGRLVGFVGVVFVAEGIANYISFVMLPLAEWLRPIFAAVFTVLLTVPAHYAGVFAVDAIFNWDRRHGDDIVERVHQKVVLGTCLFLLALAVALTVALGFMRDAYFYALRSTQPGGLFAAMDPTALTVALLLGALAGIVAIVLIAAKHQAGEVRREWTDELKLTEGERKALEERCAGLRVQIEEAHAKYDVVAEKYAARGLATRRRGAAIRAQYDRTYENEQLKLGREPTLPHPEPEPAPQPYYEPIVPAHEALPAGHRKDVGVQNGAGDKEEAERLLAQQRKQNGGE